MPERFRDTGESLWHFTATYLVRCPRCSARAVVRPASPEDTEYDAPRALTCTSCGFTDRWPRGSARTVQTIRTTVIADGILIARAGRWHAIAIGKPVDPYFRLPLWLQSPCAGHTLWAYNAEHLDVLERYVAAHLRQRVPYVNRSLASRLPTWMKDRKHRDAILTSIAKLRETL